MAMNRHTDIKNRILKTRMEIYNNKRRKLLKIHFFINLRKKIIFLRDHFCFIKQNLRILSNFYKNHRKELHIL